MGKRNLSTDCSPLYHRVVGGMGHTSPIRLEVKSLVLPWPQGGHAGAGATKVLELFVGETGNP